MIFFSANKPDLLLCSHQIFIDFRKVSYTQEQKIRSSGTSVSLSILSMSDDFLLK